MLKNYNYLTAINTTVNSGCLTRPPPQENQNATGMVDLSKSLYKDNLKAPNWVYGNITEAQYKYYLFSKSAQYNLTSCPLATPYVSVDEKSCIKCAGTYKIGERECVTCPDGQHYVESTAKCEATAVCSNGTVLNQTTNQCVTANCPEGETYNQTANKCVSICKPNEFYNSTTQQCQVTPQNCPVGEKFNPSTGLCEKVECPAGQVFDYVTNSCVDKYNNSVSLCPPDKPFWNATAIKCQACPSQTPIFNKDLNRCEPCPNGLAWNPNRLRCEVSCAED